MDKSKLTTDSYKGVRDFLPKDWAKMQAMFTTIRNTLDKYGYEEYNASPLERSELYETKTSEEIVNEQTYTFTDRGERRVTIRPEMTPTLARMIAGNRRNLTFPLRWFSIPNVFRYERPQKGRLREHYQLNVDIIGNVNNTQADIETLTIVSAILKAFGAEDSDFTIRISSRKLLNLACSSVGLNDDETKVYTQILDRKSKMPKEDFTSSVQKITATDPLEIIESNENPDIKKETETLTKIINELSKQGITNVSFDPEITRGFDYYTGIVFEVYDTNKENSRSLFGGGRYDKLMTLFGEDPISAVGFGMGDVTLSDFLETHNLTIKDKDSSDLFLGTIRDDEIELSEVENVAQKLRNQNISVFKNISNKSVSDQLREANKRKIQYFTIVGADELKSGVLRIKDLLNKTEKEVEISQAKDVFTK